MAGDFDVSDADYERDVANPPHSPTDVEEPPRDAQPARLSGEVL